MKDYRILVADSSESSRNKICSLLNRKGYKTYHASDGAGAIRMSRNVSPNIVILDTNIWGLNAFDVAEVIEGDRLSTVVFITNNPTQSLLNKLREMTLYAYVLKPINPEQLYQIIEFAVINSSRINTLSQKVEKLENTLESRKKIDRAKGLLMDKLQFSEKEAYNYLRKKSMDLCISMDKMADKILNEIK